MVTEWRRVLLVLEVRDGSTLFVVVARQGPEHPNPGKPFTARGFPRHCYLPDSEKGRKVKDGARRSAVWGAGRPPCSRSPAFSVSIRNNFIGIRCRSR